MLRGYDGAITGDGTVIMNRGVWCLQWLTGSADVSGELGAA